MDLEFHFKGKNNYPNHLSIGMLRMVSILI